MSKDNKFHRHATDILFRLEKTFSEAFPAEPVKRQEEEASELPTAKGAPLGGVLPQLLRGDGHPLEESVELLAEDLNLFTETKLSAEKCTSLSNAIITLMKVRGAVEIYMKDEVALVRWRKK